MSIVGRTYLERGKPVRLLNGFSLPSKRNPLPPCPLWLLWYLPEDRLELPGPPRNVAIRRASGEQVVRPFRGLRKPPANSREVS